MTTSDAPGQGTRPLRQWSVTITEATTREDLQIMLRWRTFPCTAQHWDGVASASLRGHADPIDTQEALRDVLAAVSLVEWEMGVRTGHR